MKLSMARKAAFSLLVVAGVCVPAAAASAAKPVVQACVGTTYSDAAHALTPGDLGQVVRSFAQDPGSPPGLGDGIQGVQAGLVPDEVVLNACN
jgi:hypothetical protein